MATLLLAAAGSAVGGAIGGSILGVGAATIGQAAGAVVGGLLDQKLLGRGSRSVDVGRARSLRLQTSTEGTPVPRVYGRMRLSGTVIWSTRFLERVTERREGGKGGGGSSTKVREYSYSISLAIAVCEGPIDRVGRIWADGKEIDVRSVTYRVYTGDDAQGPDPKIEAVEGSGNVPHYRGTAYVVFEDLALGAYGNRIPQFSFEVFRAPGRDAGGLAGGLDPAAQGEPLTELIEAVALSPGTGEFALHDAVHRYVGPGGSTSAANVATTSGKADLEVALDQLQADLPACKCVSLVVSWFGDDLRCGRCTIRPKIEKAGRRSIPTSWTASGLTTDTAGLISQDADGTPIYGGSPSDASIIAAIEALKARGLEVMVYPFILMDVPSGNGRPDPYDEAAEQSALPWRGRITLDKAPGQPGSSDQTAAAAADVAAFFGTAAPSDFDLTGTLPVFHGAAGDWGLRRFVLHLAALAEIAGGVDAFCIGSEMRGLTQIRDGRTSYPAVEAFRQLAGDVKLLLPGAKLTYAADWSEYFGHHPAGGSGDHLFHLDPLWADPAIDFVGIDDYMSCSDWRYYPAHLDAASGVKSVYALDYLTSNVAGGENFDWYYASDADRLAQVRTPIVDTQHGEDWIFRPKDIEGWWENAHYNRVGGVRQTTPTAWLPEMKPVRLTETGCSAIDLGANQPNVFLDPKSSESALPHFSRGVRDDEMQRRFLQAKIGYWRDHGSRVSSVYGGPMLEADGIYVWTWDARPWPAFPNRTATWADGPNHRRGHWITGRVTASSLAETVASICARGGVADCDVNDLHGALTGYLVDRPATVREALQPLMTAFGFDAFESGGRIVFRMRGTGPDAVINTDRLIEVSDHGYAVELTREAEGESVDGVRYTFLDAESSYETATVEALLTGSAGIGVEDSSALIAMPRSQAQGVANRWLAEVTGARDEATLALPPSMLSLEAGDVVVIDDTSRQWRVERVERGEASSLELTRINAAQYLPSASEESSTSVDGILVPGPVEGIFLDLPLASDGEDTGARVVASAAPWPGAIDLYRISEGGSFSVVGQQRRPGLTGVVATTLQPGVAGYWQRVSFEVEMIEERVFSVSRLDVLAGANALAVETAPGLWEILQFREALLVGPHRYRLSHLLRGQRGTESAAGAEIAPGARVVVLDDAVLAPPIGIEDLGINVTYAFGDSRLSPDDPAYTRSVATPAGRGLVPYSPAHLRLSHQGDDTVFFWIRRTRIGGDSWFGTDVPLGEEAERYAVEVREGGGLRRSLSVSEPRFVYDAMMRAEDGITGPYSVRVAQLSVLMGAGEWRSIEVDD
ncbi:MAG: glycoside hydrolase/phage tail family protein [Pseudomonadota bacterium]